MKILIPVMGFGRSGGERVLSNLANTLIEKGHDVVFVKPDNGEKPYYKTNVRIIESKYIKSGNKTLRYLKNAYNLIKKCRELNFDVAIANYFITAYIVFCLPSKVSKFYYIQANEMKLNKRILFKILAIVSYFLPLKKIVNSKHILPDIISRHIGVVPAGISVNEYKSEVYPSTFSNDKVFKIGLIGRKEYYKGTNEIIDILISLPEDIKQHIQINIAVYLPIKKLPFLWNYKFYKIEAEKDLINFYKDCDLILALGLIENGAFHYPCAEAMASGRLVISNYAPLSETSSKFYLNEFCYDLITKKIYEMFTYSSEQISMEIDSNFQEIEKFSWNSVGDKFERLILKNI